MNEEKKARRKNPRTLSRDIEDAQTRLGVAGSASVDDLKEALKDEFFKGSWQ